MKTNIYIVLTAMNTAFAAVGFYNGDYLQGMISLLVAGFTYCALITSIEESK